MDAISASGCKTVNKISVICVKSPILVLVKSLEENRAYVDRRRLRPCCEYADANPRSCHGPHYITSDDDHEQAQEVDAHDHAETRPCVFVVLSGIVGRIPKEIEGYTM